jgi:hypothetical protein
LQPWRLDCWAFAPMIIDLQMIDFPLRLIQCLNIYLLEIGSILYGRIKPIQIMLENIYG